MSLPLNRPRNKLCPPLPVHASACLFVSPALRCYQDARCRDAVLPPTLSTRHPEKAPLLPPQARRGTHTGEPGPKQAHRTPAAEPWCPAKSLEPKECGLQTGQAALLQADEDPGMSEPRGAPAPDTLAGSEKPSCWPGRYHASRAMLSASAVHENLTVTSDLCFLKLPKVMPAWGQGGERLLSRTDRGASPWSPGRGLSSMGAPRLPPRVSGVLLLAAPDLGQELAGGHQGSCLGFQGCHRFPIIPPRSQECYIMLRALSHCDVSGDARTEASGQGEGGSRQHSQAPASPLAQRPHKQDQAILGE